MSEPEADQLLAMPPALSRAGVDRAAHRRTDDDWLAGAWADPAARVLVLDDGRAQIADTEAGPALVLVPPADAPAGERIFLGESAGGAYFAVLDGALPRVPGSRPAGLRDVGALLGDRDAGLFVHAVGLANWHATHLFCPRCGGPTAPGHGGSVRVCEQDGAEHFPRTDPAVIMLVHDGGERCVLGRSARWPGRFYSTLAGFVEPGESAEQAVAREVAEEVGLHVTDVRYAGSQPWPFPASLMLGFTARATDEELRVDGAELATARWFARAELRDGAAQLPGEISIAHRLITGWLAGP